MLGLCVEDGGMSEISTGGWKIEVKPGVGEEQMSWELSLWTAEHCGGE